MRGGGREGFKAGGGRMRQHLEAVPHALTVLDDTCLLLLGVPASAGLADPAPCQWRPVGVVARSRTILASGYRSRQLNHWFWHTDAQLLKKAIAGRQLAVNERCKPTRA